MFTLKIGRRVSQKVESIAEAQEVYRKVRDESLEGASTFPAGSLTGDGKKYRISYNGRVWDGDTAIA